VQQYPVFGQQFVPQVAGLGLQLIEQGLAETFFARLKIPKNTIKKINK
jgi:hypothetical protein